MTDGIRKNGGNPEKLQVKSFTQKLVTLPEGPDMLLVPPYKVEELSLSDLYRLARSQTEQQGRNALLKLSEKLSYISLGLPLLLIGLPVLLVVCRSQKRDLSIAIPASCFLAFVVWGIWGVLQSLAKTSHLHFLVAAWLVHGVIVGSAILFFQRLSRT